MSLIIARPTHIVENNQLIRPSAILITNAKKQPTPRQRRDQLLQEQQQQHAADDREVEVVHLEQSIQFQRFPALHDLPPSEDDEIVADERNGGLLQCAHRCGTGLEAEVFGRIALDLLESGGEDGPEVDAEGAVEGWGSIFEPGGLGAHVGGVVA